MMAAETPPIPRPRLRNIVIGRMVVGVFVLGTALFLPAGTFRYWEAWVYLAVLMLPMSILALYLLKHDPVLLERRLRVKEKEPQQKRIVAASSALLAVALILPGFDRRFGWSSVPVWLVIIADLAILSAYWLYVVTLRENEFAAHTIRVEERQRVVDTGVYSHVRHPMYVASILMFCCSPLALGSYWALVPVGFFPLLIVARILNEEKLLLRDLEGYGDYCKAVRWRLVPGIW